MEIPIYKETSFKLFAAGYVVLGIITAYLCYKASKKKSKSVFFWTVLGYLLPIIPYIFFNYKYNEQS